MGGSSHTHTHDERAYFGVSRAMNGVVKGRILLFAEILSFTSGDLVEKESDGADIGDNEKHSEEFEMALGWDSLSHAILL